VVALVVDAATVEACVEVVEADTANVADAEDDARADDDETVHEE
jgi:hypothetical protein